MSLNGSQYSLGVDVEQFRDKGVGMLCNELARDQEVGREILQVGCHDHVRSPVDCCGKSMTAFGVGQVDFGNEIVESCHKGVREMPIHD